MPQYLRQLNLTDAQRDWVFEIMDGQSTAMREKVKAARDAEESLSKLVLSPDYSEPKARELSDSAARATADLSLARAMAERQVYAVLTAEQRSQLAKLKAGDKGPMAGHDAERRPPPTSLSKFRLRLEGQQPRVLPPCPPRLNLRSRRAFYIV